MFKNEFQGGPYFEVFSTQGKDSTAGWKMPSSGCKKVYDKEVKGYIYVLEGTSATTKIHLPKDSRTSCTLVQHFLILQINIFIGKEFSVELGVSDLGNNKRRILLSTSQKEMNITPLHAKIPLTVVRRNLWVNLCLDMLSLVSDTWKGQTYRAIESITVSANCKIKRIFTMKVQPPDTTDDDELYGCLDLNSDELESIPKQCQLASDINQVTQVLTINKIRHSEKCKGDSVRPSSLLDLSNLDLSSSGRKLLSTGKDGKHHIAFGSKVPVPEHPRKTLLGNATSRSFRSLSSRNDEVFSSEFVASSMTSQDGFNSIRSTQSAACHPPASSRHSHNPDTATVEEVDTAHSETSQDHIVAPHPPHRPSSDQPRRRPRVKNSTLHKDRQSSVGRDEPANESVSLNSHIYSRTVSLESTAIDSVRESRSNGIVNGRSPGQSSHRQTRNFPSLKGSGLPQTTNRLRSSKEMGVGPDVPEIQRSQNVMVEDSMSNIIGLLNDKTAESGSSSSGSDEETSQPGEYEDSDEEEPSSQNQLHVFASRPTKAPLRIRSPGTAVFDTGQNKTGTAVKTTRVHARGAQPENDFWSSSEEEEMHGKGWKSGSRPHSGTSSTGASPKTNVKSGSHCRGGSGSQSRGGSGNQGRGGSGNQGRGGSGNQGRGGSENQGRGESGNQSRGESENQGKGGSENQDRGGSGNLGRGDAESLLHEMFDGVKPKINVSAPKPSSISPEHKQFNPALYTAMGSQNGGLLTSAVSMSRTSVREIPKSDARLLQAVSSERPYDHTLYQMADVTESFEARMFLSMQRQDEETSPESPRKDVHLLHTSPRRQRQFDQLNPHLHSESPATTSDDDTSFSTWKAPAPNQTHHNYQDEMKSRLSSDTLTSSNPRDWSGGIFSPPINFPNVGDLQNTATSEDLSETNVSPRKHSHDSHPDVIKNEEELNLFFDSSLNCYYDPKTHKYYELAS
ncbi:protein CFAP20DC-like isoform X2 [Gigantopelta aegis]|uniref:protein CFAP20DC-like isoform X2 n=1 Tax=Gigantopelta aegis TaxID=1735272 RepID=UPI001B889A65|nr:protein CFAP20DC-like isoform X2 [Gigantopelta aegis]